MRRARWVAAAAAVLIPLVFAPPAGAAPASSSPLGAVDLVEPDGKYNLMTVAGWAFDPDDPAGTTSVAIYVDGVGVNWFPTGHRRPDVQRVHPVAGLDAGFVASFPNPPGRGAHQVCVYAINRGPGGTTLLGCRGFTVSVVTELFGSIDRVERTGDASFRAYGWAFSAGDAISPTPFLLVPPGDAFNLGAAGNRGQTGLSRPDVDAAFPGHGSQHGFEQTFTLTGSAAAICLAIPAQLTTLVAISGHCHPLP